MIRTTLAFVDTETTGLDFDDEIWEFAALRRNLDGTTAELLLHIEHDVEKAVALPDRFLDDYRSRYSVTASPVTKTAAAYLIREFLDGATWVGANPAFDTRLTAALLWANGLRPSWSYHLLDIEAMTVGALVAVGEEIPGRPSSHWLSRKVGVEPDTYARHTAMGDVAWVADWFDAVNRGVVEPSDPFGNVSPAGGKW
ncbi:exonuclease domain-containing protein [Gordonia sp. N1V]|uniref:exonuclease domain-containing protein n=1 Tax=Gordonia sp. N1V TaxID=3034163 RepID=UPI0023E17F1C|nr:exonuclease domain-containing protein [Gordonia sp. N1V]MDF3280886.1 exonuclease domain-containing protein [Gordonia sp. N1V]